MLIYRWNGLLSRTQSPPYNNVFIIYSFEKRILKQNTLILPSVLFKPNCEVIHILTLFSGIFTNQLFLAIATPDLRPANGEDAGLIPGLERSLAVGNINPLQYPCLENFMDRGAWQATIHGVAKSQTQLSNPGYTQSILLKKGKSKLQ